VLNPTTRELSYSGGGHPPAIIVGADGTVKRLDCPGMIIGAFSFANYSENKITLDPGSRLYVFSDGCYEVTDPAERMMTVEEFGGILGQCGPQADSLDQVIAAVRGWQQRPDFEDDFSLMQLRV